MIEIREGDCLDEMRKMAREGRRVDAIVTDAPYHLQSIHKRFAKSGRTESTRSTSGAHQRLAEGFLGKQWDGGDIAQRPDFWRTVGRVLKPGGWLFAFSSTRTQDLMVHAIRGAGFEIRDQIPWIYSQGFAKNKAQADGSRIALSPANEPICVARKPIAERTVEANLAHWGTGSLNVEDCRIGDEERSYSLGAHRFNRYEQEHGARPDTYCREDLPPKNVTGRFPKNVIMDGSEEVLSLLPSGAQAFFYCAKPSASERAFKHPTVKPVALMRYLVRLACPAGGTVLDPFAGTGQTGFAARLEGRRSILIEKEPEYAEGLRKRFSARRRIV